MSGKPYQMVFFSKIHEQEEEEDREPSPEPPLFVPVRESTEPEAQPPPDGTTAQYEQLFERLAVQSIVPTSNKLNQECY